jgi:hypothetical protein
MKHLWIFIYQNDYVLKKSINMIYAFLHRSMYKSDFFFFHAIYSPVFLFYKNEAYHSVMTEK